MRRLRVLLPIDQSDFSQQALPVAGSILNPENTVITLLQVTRNPSLPETQFPPSSLYGGAYEVQAVKPDPAYKIHLDELRANIASNLRNQVQDNVLRLESEGFRVVTEVRFGDPAEEIVLEAARDYDMIIMATHARSGINRVLLGSVAEKVMRNSDVPVMLFKPEMTKVSA